MNIPDWMAVHLLYASSYLWLIVATLFFLEVLQAHIRARRAYELSRTFGNGRKVVATGRFVMTRWFLIGAFLAFTTGLIAVAGLHFLPQPPLNTSLVTALLRFILPLMLLSVWRAKVISRHTFENLMKYDDLSETQDAREVEQNDRECEQNTRESEQNDRESGQNERDTR